MRERKGDAGGEELKKQRPGGQGIRRARRTESREDKETGKEERSVVVERFGRERMREGKEIRRLGIREGKGVWRVRWNGQGTRTGRVSRRGRGSGKGRRSEAGYVAVQGG